MRLRLFLAAGLLLGAAAQAGVLPKAGGVAQPQIPMALTHHYDNNRTGWNPLETTLTPANVGGITIKHTVTLLEQVDNQPLFVPSYYLTGHPDGLIYIADAGNNIYRIDPSSGVIINQANFGTPVPYTALPGAGACTDNGLNIGITSTPVIDPIARRLYFIAYTFPSSINTYVLHAVDMDTLADVVSPRTVPASGILSDSSTYAFDAAVSRQRPGLLLTPDGNLYAGFGSFCDFATNTTRGWLLGWKASTLAPLSTPSYLLNQNATIAGSFFLTSIWQSGFALAADSASNIYFNSGNSSDVSGSYNSPFNLSESAYKISAGMAGVSTFFTPSNQNTLDTADADLTGGGLMLLPNPVSGVNVALTSGKSNPLFLLNRDSMGGLGGQIASYATLGYGNGGPTYWVGSDGVGRIALLSGDGSIGGPSGGTNQLQIWKVQAGPTLAIEHTSPILPNAGGFSFNSHPGAISTVSSNSINNAIIWLTIRPGNRGAGSSDNVMLYAMDPTNLATPLFSAVAGVWTAMCQANTVPIVMNGRVFVATYKQLNIFGL